MKKISTTLIISVIATGTSLAQKKAIQTAATTQPSGLTTTEILIFALFIFAVIALFSTLVIINALKVMIRERANPTIIVEQTKSPLDYLEWVKQKNKKPNIWTKILGLKPLEEEESLIIPHAYDEIHELNNPIPRWFSVLFYATMVFAASYLYYYHVSNGQRQDDEYVAEIEKADEAKRNYLAKSAEKFDEKTIKIDGKLVGAGKGIFNANCIACHGNNGQGVIGPNLTDQFWIHGGSISDIFRTVKQGATAKGMPSWEKNLSAKNIAEVANYIVSLQGSNPANAKSPQGEKYEVESATDTVVNDNSTQK